MGASSLESVSRSRWAHARRGIAPCSLLSPSPSVSPSLLLLSQHTRLTEPVQPMLRRFVKLSSESEIIRKIMFFGNCLHSCPCSFLSPPRPRSRLRSMPHSSPFLNHNPALGQTPSPYSARTVHGTRTEKLSGESKAVEKKRDCPVLCAQYCTKNSPTLTPKRL